MRDFLASGQAQRRQEVAQRLGVHRHTIGRGLAISAAGGLNALLTTYVPAGNPVSRAPDVLASLEQALRRPQGFASDEAWRPGVARTHGGQVKDKPRYTLVRTRFTAKRKVARPRHTQKPRRHGGLPGERSWATSAGAPARA